MVNQAFKVLIVDDDRTLSNSMAEMVRRAGFKPLVVNKASDALNLVRLQTVNAAIVDVLLPKMTGVELVQEFRKTKFANNPVIFVSGVFKDKTFSNETLKNTGAADFLFKPFQAEDLVSALKECLQPQVNAEKWSIQSLLTRKLSSERERNKALEQLDRINGLDFPFVLSILMDTASSGHLNIASDNGDIFGVTLLKGAITEVDSSESQATGVLSLISKGFLRQEDWDEFQKSGLKKFSLDRLVDEGFVSPHAVSSARREQILHDFRAICASGNLQINFSSQDPGEAPPAKHAVRANDLLTLLGDSSNDFFSDVYLQNFYGPMLDAPMVLMAEMEDVEIFWKKQALPSLNEFKDVIQSGGTLNAALELQPGLSMQIFRSLHQLVLHRLMMFSDPNRTKSINNMLERYKKLYDELKNKSADKVFEYFGANINSSSSVIQNIFEEYARANRPELLGKEATPELRELCKNCYDLVNQAREILTNEDLKARLLVEIRGQQAERQAISQRMMNEGLETLRRGQFREAVDKLKEAEQHSTNHLLIYISAWAETKLIGSSSKPRLQELVKKLDSTSAEERRSAYYFMAMGLVRKYLGESAIAINMFEKAVAADSQFVEARRELRTMQNPAGVSEGAPVTKKMDLLNGDITEIVSNIFRRKAE